MDNSIYISFIVPIYNVSAFLDDCVKSICRIKNPEIEILLINDGSTDSCPAICQKYAEMDRRVHVVTQENQGVSASRNNGLMLAKGEWVCFVDGDDCLTDQFESRIICQIDDLAEVNCFGYQMMINNKEPEWIDRGVYSLTGNELWELRMRLLDKEAYQASPKFPDTVSFVAPVTKFIKREKLLEWGIVFDKTVTWGEDALFNFQLLQYVERVRVIDCTGYYYRVNPESVTQRYDVHTTERFCRLIKAMGAEVEKIGNEEATRQYQVFVLKNLLQSVQRDMLNPQNPDSYGKRREDYLRVRHFEPVRRALKNFPYGAVRPLYRVAIGITAIGSYGLLRLFYQIKLLKEGRITNRRISNG